MNTGIMSMQRVSNYGSYLQAYGLKRVIESLGHSVQFVDYVPESSLVKEGKVPVARSIIDKMYKAICLLSPAYREYRAKQIRLNQSFAAFCYAYQNEFLPAMGVTDERNYTPRLDALVIGSDEVFNCTQRGNLVGYSRQLFGRDCRAKRLLSYAASFGSTTMEKIEKHQIREEIAAYISAFDAVSVRDQNSEQIIRALCDRIPEKHIDPVLLYEFPEVDSIQIHCKDYIIVYAYANRITEDEACAIRAFAKAENKRILCLGFYQPFCDEYILASPLEVLAYFKHADYVITDTFHGSVFSIKYQTPFTTIIRDSNRQKLDDLLTTLGVSDRRIQSLEQMTEILKRPMNRSEICRRIEMERAAANEYLLRELGMAEL